MNVLVARQLEKWIPLNKGYGPVDDLMAEE